MKSFVAFPSEFQKMLHPPASGGSNPGKVIAHYELYKKVRNLDGSVVKCGISAEEGFTRFAMFKSLLKTRTTQKMIAFQGDPAETYGQGNLENTTPLKFQVNSSLEVSNNIQQVLVEKGINENIEFIAGDVHDSIPNYLIENPELKIAFLNIDLDCYEATLTSLEYFYPRLIQGGILVLDNYFKNQEERRAFETYFSQSKVFLNNFSVCHGPHYIIK
jgi:hypothetical protein